MADDVLPKILKSVQQDFEKYFGKSEVVAKAFADLKSKKQHIKQSTSLVLKLENFYLWL